MLRTPQRLGKLALTKIFALKLDAVFPPEGKFSNNWIVIVELKPSTS